VGRGDQLDCSPRLVSVPLIHVSVPVVAKAATTAVTSVTRVESRSGNALVPSARVGLPSPGAIERVVRQRSGGPMPGSPPAARRRRRGRRRGRLRCRPLRRALPRRSVPIMELPARPRLYPPRMPFAAKL
jgi:hypothetical protein